jgi:indole-3-glycerol phosphate synthase
MTYLDVILERRSYDVRSEKSVVPLEMLEAMVAQRGPRRSFAEAVISEAPAIVAEIKRASPSAGPIDPSCQPVQIARAYEQGGAKAISVLTEPARFGGSFADLRSARAAVHLPVLCKDFIVDDFQLWKAAAFGADAVLLIAAVLDDDNLHRLLQVARRLGLDCLIEVHTQRDVDRAVAAGGRIIGINNRNLQTFEVDLGVAPRLRAAIPPELAVVAESGYWEPAQLRVAMKAGITSFLVGEALMRSTDRARMVRRLREAQAS